jgi:hypothetical protein
MSCCNDITKVRVSIAASAIVDGALTSGNVFHDGALKIPCAAFDVGGRGKILQAYLQVNNNVSSAITSTYTLHIHNNADLTAQTKGQAPSSNDTDHAAFQGKIEMPALVAMVGDGNVSDALFKEVNLEYGVSDSGNELYFFITGNGGTFDNSATIIIDFILLKY